LKLPSLEVGLWAAVGPVHVAVQAFRRPEPLRLHVPVDEKPEILGARALVGRGLAAVAATADR